MGLAGVVKVLNWLVRCG